MKQYMITFRSVTYAQRGERSLTRRGIGCTVMRTPKWMEDQGCGYGLRLRGKAVPVTVPCGLGGDPITTVITVTTVTA